MKNEMIVFENQEFGKLTVVEIEGKPWFIGREVATMLGYKNTPDAIKQHCKYAKLLSNREIELLEIAPRGIQIINEKDVLTLLTKSRIEPVDNAREWILEILSGLSTKDYVPIIVRDEHVALKTIEQILRCKLIRQFQVGAYFVDGYDKKNNVVYEIDENGHAGKEKEDDIREAYIKDSLECKFVRITI